MQWNTGMALAHFRVCTRPVPSQCSTNAEWHWFGIGSFLCLHWASTKPVFNQCRVTLAQHWFLSISALGQCINTALGQCRPNEQNDTGPVQTASVGPIQLTALAQCWPNCLMFTGYMYCHFLHITCIVYFPLIHCFFFLALFQGHGLNSEILQIITWIF